MTADPGESYDTIFDVRLNQLMVVVAGSLMSTVLSAAPIYQPPGPGLTYGDVSFGQRAFASMGNPAASAADLDQRGGEAKSRPSDGGAWDHRRGLVVPHCRSAYTPSRNSM